MNLIAHRGFAADAPENTVPALRRAAALADGVELDVRRCGSGEPVVCHDETVDRLTDASGHVDSLDSAALADLNVLGSDYGIPTLDAVFDALPATTVNVELKEAGLAADVADCWASYDGDVFVSAFDADVLAEVRDAAPATSRAALCRQPTLDAARELDCAFVHPEQRVVDSAFVERAHDAGIEVNAWTVTSPASVSRLREAGVDGVIADSASVVER